MVVLFGEPEDEHLLWLAAALKERQEAVELVTPQQILADSILTIRLDRAWTSSSLRLRDGRTIEHDLAGAVINRLFAVSLVRSTGSAADDAYVAEEWRAALAAWLRTLKCPVLNPPRAASLAGPEIAPAAWHSLARAHGIPTGTWRSEEQAAPVDPVDLICVGDVCMDVGGSAPSVLQARLCRMARFVGAPLIGARFDRARGWAFVGATISPPLMSAGQLLVDAVLELSREARRA